MYNLSKFVIHKVTSLILSPPLAQQQQEAAQAAADETVAQMIRVS